MQIEELVNHYNLLPHPEGGFYRQTYAASEQIHNEALQKDLMAIVHFQRPFIFSCLPEVFLHSTASKAMRSGIFMKAAHSIFMSFTPMVIMNA